MTAAYLIAFAPMTAPAGREASVRAQAGAGGTKNLDPRGS